MAKDFEIKLLTVNLEMDRSLGALVSKVPQRGLKMVFGVPDEIKPIEGAPKGKYKLRLRTLSVARLIVRTTDGIRTFLLEDRGAYWFANPKLQAGRNERRLQIHAHLHGTDIRRFKVFAFA